MTRPIRVLLAVSTLCALGGPIARAQQEQPGQQEQSASPAGRDTGKLKVGVQYKGPGTVDEKHRIFVWLFGTPMITAESIPIGSAVIDKNEGSFKFTGLPKEVYIAAAYDEQGAYDGLSGAPPSGTPVTVHGAATNDGLAVAVPTGGDDVTVTVTFDDSSRMP
jgi:hypothetical protein